MKEHVFVTADSLFDFPQYLQRASPHGQCKTSTYLIWNAMKARCTNKKRRYYERYGGRGIGICSRWLVFQNFLEDMGERPDKLEIDRIDNNAGYCKENCRWTTRQMNTANRSRGPKSKYRIGASRRKCGRFAATICIDYKTYHLGMFATELEAHDAYKKVALEWYGFVPNYNNWKERYGIE